MNRTFHLALIFLVLSNLLSTNLFSQNENNDSTIISFTTDQITELSKIPYEWISYQGKINIINEDNKEMSAQFFFANKIDSIIYFNLHLSGIELGRLVLTPDSMVFVNKMSKTYFYGDVSYLQKVFGIPLDFNFLQATLNGRSIPADNNLYHLHEDSIGVTLSADPLYIGKDSIECAQRIVLDNQHNITQITLEVAELMEEIVITYSQYIPISEFLFFTECTIENSLFEINCQMKNIKFETPFNININIPKNFKYSEVLF